MVDGLKLKMFLNFLLWKMSNTTRKDKNGKTLKEGLKKKDGVYRCNCHYCVGFDRNELIEKIADKELETEIKQLNIS